MAKNTSWDKAAKWYDTFIEEEKGTYQKDLILPNLIRLLSLKKGEALLDLACGQGFFTRSFSNTGAKVIGVDVSDKLISIAKKRSPSIPYYVSFADNMPFIQESSIDKITIILAIQNIENASPIFKECNRILKHHGKIYLVLNHPAFRIPKETSWSWDEEKKIQYRRIDSYLSESRVKIQLHPGSKPEDFTWSFHRSLQYYSKTLYNNGFYIARMEEWNSHKRSEPGPQSEAENKARREIPLFLFIEAIKAL